MVGFDPTRVNPKKVHPSRVSLEHLSRVLLYVQCSSSSGPDGQNAGQFEPGTDGPRVGLRPAVEDDRPSHVK